MAVSLLSGLSATCYRPGDHKKRFEHPDTYAPLSEAQRAHVDELIARADASPTEFAPQKRAGLALMNFTLSGALDLQRDAERLLERAYELRSDDDELNRVLGRFYNMRAVEHDFSKAAWQKRVYGSLLGDLPPAELSDMRFVAYSFYSLAQIIELAEHNKLVRALKRLRQLERELEQRVTADPGNIEIHALAGNFAVFFAGYVPTGRRRRIDTGIEHFEVVRERWSDMPLPAKDPRHCPNTYENFMFELAEAHLARKHDDRARALYRELAEVRPPATRAKELIAAVSRHRLANFDTYRGQLELMPPWPSDVGNCVVCHSYTGDIPESTLFVNAPLLLAGLPSHAVEKPLDVASTTVAVGYPESAAEAQAIFTQHCASCHFTGGRASGVLDLAQYDQAAEHAEWIVEAVDEGNMPPDERLSATEREVLRRWAATLDAQSAR